MKRYLALIVLLLSVSTGPAFSHSTLVRSTPEVDSTVVQMPTTITLEFNEQLLVLGENSGNRLSLMGPTGASVTLENLAVAGEKLSASMVDSEFADGQYVVKYRAVSADGHIITNQYEFTLQSDLSQAQVTSIDEPESSTVNRWLAIVSGLVLLAAIVTTWLRLRDSKEQ